MPSLTRTRLAIAAAATLAGSTVFSAIGFGIGMVSIPILLLAFDAQTAVVVLNTVEVPLSVLMVWQNRRHLERGEILPITIAGLAGAIVGAFVLAASAERPLRISIIALIVVLTAVTALNLRAGMPMPRFLGPVIGFLVGLMLTALGVGGPLLALYMLARQWRRDAIRGSMSLLFLFVMPAAVAGYAITGLYDAERLTLTAATLAPVIAGFFLGSRIARAMNERVFRIAAIAVIAATSTVVLVREVAAL